MDGFDSESIEDAEDAYDEAFEDGHDEGLEASNDEGMSEREALDTYSLAFALGFGEEVGLNEAEHIRAMEMMDDFGDGPDENLISIKKAQRKTLPNRMDEDGRIISTLTGKPICPFEQWIMDVCAGRKSIKDPIGGENTYETEYETGD